MITKPKYLLVVDFQHVNKVHPALVAEEYPERHETFALEIENDSNEDGVITCDNLHVVGASLGETLRCMFIHHVDGRSEKTGYKDTYGDDVMRDFGCLDLLHIALAPSTISPDDLSFTFDYSVTWGVVEDDCHPGTIDVDAVMPDHDLPGTPNMRIVCQVKPYTHETEVDGYLDYTTDPFRLPYQSKPGEPMDWMEGGITVG